MIDGKSILAIVPARGGSKGLTGKNILPLVDKPLIVWSLEAARESKNIDKCIGILPLLPSELNIKFM